MKHGAVCRGEQQSAIRRKQLLQILQDAGVFLEFREGCEFSQDQPAIQSCSLADDDAFDIDPVLRSIGEGFQYDQIFCTAGADPAVR